jgi:hypothetical protein
MRASEQGVVGATHGRRTPSLSKYRPVHAKPGRTTAAEVHAAGGGDRAVLTDDVLVPSGTTAVEALVRT